MASIIRIGKRNWVMGMSWVAYEDTPSKAELKADANRTKSSWVSVRIGQAAIQGGFCPPIGTMKRPSKLYSLAAYLADSREQPWLGTFKIEDGLWWYIAVRDNHAILPNGDIIGGEAAIRAAREQHSGFTDWNYLEGDLSVLSEFIDEVQAKPTPVRSLTDSGVNPLMIAGSGLVLAAAAGGYLYWDHKLEADRIEREAAQARMRAQLAANTSIEAAPSPLLTTPKPNEWLEACRSILHPLPLSQYGWSLDAVSCADRTANVTWARKDGATIDYRPEGALSADGNKVDQPIPLPDISRDNANDALPLQQGKDALLAWAQAVDFKLNFIQAGPAPQPLPGAAPTMDAKNTPPLPPQAAFGLDIPPVSPFKIDFSTVPGLRLTGLKMSETGWHLDGVIYGR